MKPTKLTKILQSLSPEEFNDWKRFLTSSFFNTDQNLVRASQVFSSYFPSLDSSKFTKEKVFAKVFPDQPWNDGKWRNLSSKLVKSLEMFLSVLELKNNEFEQRKLLVKSLGKRNLTPFLENETKSLGLDYAQIQPNDLNVLLDQALLNESFYYHPLTDKISRFEFLQSAKRNFEIYYHAQQRRWSCEELVLKNLLKRRQEKLVHDLDQTQTIEQPLYSQLYQTIHDFLEKGTIIHYQTTKSFFLENIANFTSQDQKFGLLHLINFGIHQNNLGLHSYRNDMFELYIKGLEYDILLDNGQLTETSFNNIVSNSSALGHFEWTKNFIKQYELYLPPNNREETKIMALANLHFQQKDFSDVIDLLINFAPANVTYLLIGKTLLLRSYFEFFIKDHSYYNLLISYTMAFEKLVKRKKSIPSQRIAGCINLSASIRKIANKIIENKHPKILKGIFLIEIENQDSLIGKQWLIEKIKSL